MSELKKVIIGLPSCGTLRVETAASLMCMLAETPIQYQPFTPISCYIHANREKCADHAIEMEADYLLFIDSDMIFPTDAVNKLLALDKDITSVVYNFRSFPKKAVIKLDEKYDGDYLVDPSVTERPIPLNKISTPFRCVHAGTGFMLIKTEIFKKIPKPWFFMTPELPGQHMIGEDVWFCQRALENDFEIWIDPSIEVGHIGTMVY